MRDHGPRDGSSLDAWIRINAEGIATVCTGKVELGQGILTALIARGRTGEGQRVDVSLLDGALLSHLARLSVFHETGVPIIPAHTEPLAMTSSASRWSRAAASTADAVSSSGASAAAIGTFQHRAPTLRGPKALYPQGKRELLG